MKYTNKSWLEEQHYKRGREWGDIADEFGLPHATILKWKRRHGIDENPYDECEGCGDLFKELDRHDCPDDE